MSPSPGLRLPAFECPAICPQQSPAGSRPRRRRIRLATKRTRTRTSQELKNRSLPPHFSCFPPYAFPANASMLNNIFRHVYKCFWQKFNIFEWRTARNNLAPPFFQIEARANRQSSSLAPRAVSEGGPTLRRCAISGNPLKGRWSRERCMRRGKAHGVGRRGGRGRLPAARNGKKEKPRKTSKTKGRGLHHERCARNSRSAAASKAKRRQEARNPSHGRRPASLGAPFAPAPETTTVSATMSPTR